jgi:hypothetical protein
MALNSDWQVWSLQDWNEAIFGHFFTSDEESDAALSRLLVTKEELRRVTGDESASPEEVRERFLDIFRRARPRLNRALTDFDRSKDERTSSVPPFLIYLMFTCFVASADEQVLTIGDFRRRLCELLQDPSGTHYPLEGLPRLWERFRDWLHHQRGQGMPFRELVLPDPGRYVRIGYSARLAFPNRRDRLKLIQILSAFSLDENPLVEEILKSIGRALSEFSEAFCLTYDDFRTAYAAGKLDLYGHPFWSVVQETLALNRFASGERGERCVVLRLLLDADEVGVARLYILSRSPDTIRRHPDIRFCETDTGMEDYRFVVTMETEDAQGIDRAVRQFLQGRLADFLPSFKTSASSRAVADGLLIFGYNDYGQRELAVSLPEEGDLIAFVRTDLTALFLDALQRSNRGTVWKTESGYEGWDHVGGFSSRDLVRIDFRHAPRLQEIRCLKPSIRRSKAHLLHGIRLDDGYLGRSGALPSLLTTEEVARVEAYRFDPDPGWQSQEIELTRNAADPLIFDFPDRDVVGKALDGRFRLDVEHHNELWTWQIVRFRSSVTSYRHRGPAIPAQWLVEGGTAPTISAAYIRQVSIAAEPDSPSEDLHNASGLNTPRLGNEAEPCLAASVRALLSEPWVSAPAQSLPVIPPADLSDEQHSRLDDLIEICSAIALRRQGVAEPEMIEFFKKTLEMRDAPRSLLWDVIRAWVEAGYMDLLTERLISTIFDNPDFTRCKVIAREVEKVIDALGDLYDQRLPAILAVAPAAWR